MEMYNPAHPGEILLDGYIKELRLSISETALMLGISRKHLSNIVNCKVPITPETALKIAKCFKTSPEIWLKEQMAYDLWQAQQTVNLDNIRAYG
ncbi:MAG: HigA family addiction module antitoxin [Candidatus Gastranaerophilales bacterium]|nr:HigA family addiction module antitoxin [Candidatus Gastranaerophilales bacterium]